MAEKNLFINLIKILRTLDKNEAKKFSRFLCSPYYNSNENVSKTYEFIMKYYPRFSEKKLAYERIYAHIYGERKFNEITVRTLLHRLNKQAEKFLIVRKHEKDKFSSMNALLQELNSRNLGMIFKKYEKDYRNRFNITSNIDRDYYYQLNRFDNLVYDHMKLTDRKSGVKRMKKHAKKLINSDVNLTVFYISEIIFDYMNVLSHTSKYNVEIEDNFTSSLIKSIDTEKLFGIISKNNKKTFLAELYSHLLKAYIDFDNESNYFRYKESVKEHKGKLTLPEASFHYARLVNYCIRKQKAHQQGGMFDNELFEIYEEMMKTGYYKNDVNDYIPNSLFRAIVILGFKLGRTEWLEDFINSHISSVHPHYKSDLYNFGMVYVNFAKKNYDAVLEKTQIVKGDSFIYKFDMIGLRIKTLYETKNYEELFDTIHRYRVMLHTDKMLTSASKKLDKTMLNYLEKLPKYELGMLKKGLGYAYKRMSVTQNILYKDWLMQKYEKAISKEKSLPKIQDAG
jgi:hypothetical protein